MVTLLVPEGEKLEAIGSRSSLWPFFEKEKL